MAKPIFVLHIDREVSREQSETINKRLLERIGQDYHVLLLVSTETKIQVFTDREILPIDLQIEFDKLLQ